MLTVVPASYEEGVFPMLLDNDIDFELLHAELDAEAVEAGVDVGEDIDAVASVASSIPTPVPGAGWEDISRLVPTRQNKSIKTSSFEKALATFANLTGLSIQEWTALREILFLVRDKDGQTPPVIESHRSSCRLYGTACATGCQ
ncbi:hypothetical protein B0H67DRAFT_558331 [Lasiosphaeris hirsuta]|uniref:Uncharacterized protein n=1 Tax=Lasiosphaeris hirsuta TaxID=260670 RepID=A0AA39ZSB4_9PEZI|nr:hypothetical protein B0H67DRAFT_558331 [Lasiosphaeris hirsuta]